MCVSIKLHNKIIKSIDESIICYLIKNNNMKT